MKKNIRSERVITLTVLVITVVVLSILSFTIIINMKTRTNISKLSQLKSDISTLEEKVSNFYNKYGEIPADIEYTNTSSLEPIMNNKEKTSESKFYVIDLQAMKGISLNYGRDYENVKNTNTQKANEYTDIYVINNITHNIFYIKGISTEENEIYYTNYKEPKDIPII